MFATGADPKSEPTRLHEESRAWGLIRRTLPFGRSIGSLSYLISVGLIAIWIIAVFFGVGLYVVMPRSVKLEPGLRPGGTNLNASSAETPWLMPSTGRLDRLATPAPSEPPPMGDVAADIGSLVAVPASQITANADPFPMPAEAAIANTVDQPREQAELGTTSTVIGTAAPIFTSQSQPSAAPEPRGSPRSPHSPSSHKPLERGRANARTARPHAPVKAIQDVLQRHSRLLK
jgi:hypothetical protein